MLTKKKKNSAEKTTKINIYDYFSIKLWQNIDRYTGKNAHWHCVYDYKIKAYVLTYQTYIYITHSP